MLLLLSVLCLLSLTSAEEAGGCLSPCGSPCACCGKSPNGHYFLTSFDGSSCSCGPCHAHGNYFTADRQRFGCGAALHVCRGNNCVRAVVTDYGPSCFVENDAKGPVLDASPAVCKALTGGGSCGWSDHFDVVVAPAFDNRPFGPFNVTDEELAEIHQRAREFAEYPSREYFVEEQ